MSSMNPKQLTRFQKINNERFYLLNIINETDKFKLDVSGSYRNVYNLEVSKKEKTICCDCLDMKKWAKKSNCVCKHCCFVIFKVCSNSIEPDSDFFTNLVFNDIDFEKISEKLEEKSQYFNNYRYLEIADETVDAQLIDKYHKMKIKEGTVNEFLCKKSEIINPCAICCDKIDTEEENLECPDCHNVFHKTCQEKWISFGNITCALCRSSSWTNYEIKFEGEYQNLGY